MELLKEVREQEEVYKEPDKKLLVIEHFFGKYHIEAGVAYFEDYTFGAKIPYETPFEYFSVVIPSIASDLAVGLDDRAYILFMKPIRGAVSYITIGPDIESDRVKVSIKEMAKAIEEEVKKEVMKEVDFKAGLAGAGGAIGGFILNRIIK